MRAKGLTVALVAATLTMTGVPAFADHPGPSVAIPVQPGEPVPISGGPGATWEHIATIPTGNPHTDLDFFTQDGETYMAVGTLAIGPNGGGQTIIRLTAENGSVVDPEFVSNHPSASCVTDPLAALGLQHDVEATPKGTAILNTTNPFADRSDAQLLIDATDAPGRCHDNGVSGLTSAPRGGLEIIDVTDIDNPAEIALISHIGQAHTVNVDPKRPHIAYAVTSDSVAVGADRTRQNETPSSSDRFDLDGFEVVDLSSCMGFASGTTIAQKRAECRPEVYRFRYPATETALGHTLQNAVAGCHELEVYPDDTLTCASIAATVLFDMSLAFDDMGTPDDYSDDRPVGTPLPCRVRSSTSAVTPTAAPVIDCVNGDGVTLDIPGWIAIGSPSLEGVVHIGTAHHHGRGGPFPATEDIDVSHEAELSASGELVLATDERGGGVVPPGATCAAGVDNPDGNGGIHAYRVDALQTTFPSGPEEAHEAYARTPTGDKAIYRATPRTGPEPTLCTAHVFQQIPGQNRIFMGWYTQGTQVVDFVEHPDGTVEFTEAGFWIPANANTWTSHVFKMEENPDGTFTYWGATGDFMLGTEGRDAVDVFKVTLPAPPLPGGGEPDGGDRVTGGGYLEDDSGSKLNFTATVRGLDGTVRLRDKARGVKIELSDITSHGELSTPCGSVQASATAAEITGTGTFDGAPASFRACFQDGGNGNGTQDLFYLECTDGCSYDTGLVTPDDALDGGNISVRRSGSGSSDGTAVPTTVILEPVLASEMPLGASITLEVAVYDQNQNQATLDGSEVSLTRILPDGTETVFTAVTDITGAASFSLFHVGEAIYVAGADGVGSNLVELAPAR